MLYSIQMSHYKFSYVQMFSNMTKHLPYNKEVAIEEHVSSAAQ